MSDRVIKCASVNYKVEPFFIIQTNGIDQRYVASFQNIEKLKKFMLDFNEKSSNENQIRFHHLLDAEKPDIYTGLISKENFVEMLDKYNDMIIYYGFHDLMLRNSETGDYFAFDEHGLIYIYSVEDYKQILEEYGLEFKENQELNFESDHEHLSKVTDKQDLLSLIKEYKLQKIN